MDHYIVKASGERELFSEEKLRQALRNASAPHDLIEGIITEVEGHLHDGMSTHDIYALAFEILSREARESADRYSLRRSVMDLGPDGHAFEVLVGEIFEAQGFSVKTGQIVQGACVTHEVDVVADNGVERILVECKFHNQQDLKSDVKVALYVQARFDDIKKRAAREGVNEFHATWLVTNTKLSLDAIRYAECVGMKVIGWNYPIDGNLQDLIERSGLRPITSLTELNQKQKRLFLDLGIVTCKDISKNKNVLTQIGLSEEEVMRVLKEIEATERKAGKLG